MTDQNTSQIARVRKMVSNLEYIISESEYSLFSNEMIVKDLDALRVQLKSALACAKNAEMTLVIGADYD